MTLLTPKQISISSIVGLILSMAAFCTAKPIVHSQTPVCYSATILEERVIQFKVLRDGNCFRSQMVFRGKLQPMVEIYDGNPQKIVWMFTRNAKSGTFSASMDQASIMDAITRGQNKNGFSAFNRRYSLGKYRFQISQLFPVYLPDSLTYPFKHSGTVEKLGHTTVAGYRCGNYEMDAPAMFHQITKVFVTGKSQTLLKEETINLVSPGSRFPESRQTVAVIKIEAVHSFPKSLFELPSHCTFSIPDMFRKLKLPAGVIIKFFPTHNVLPSSVVQPMPMSHTKR